MEKFILKAEVRKLFGKKAKKIRAEGLLPANIFGKDFKSEAIQLVLRDFQKVFKKARKTHLVYLELAKKELPTLVQHLQLHALSDQILHVDFRKMDLKEKVETEVPVRYIGELDIVKSGEADVLLINDSVMVNCLPTNIPEKIEIDISKLKIGSEIKIKDLPKETTYDFVDDVEKLVLQISAAQKEEIPVVVAPVEVPVEAGADSAPKIADAKLAGKEEKPKTEETKAKK